MTAIKKTETKSKADDFSVIREQLNDNGAIEVEPSEVKSTQRITEILLSLGPHGTSLPEIVEKTKLRKTTVHRLLKALGAENMVIHDALARKYYMGPTITKLIWEPQITQAYLIQCARKEMENLAAITDETIVLGILLGTNHVLIDSIQSSNELRVVPPSKPTNRLFAGAANRVLLSELNDSDLVRALSLIQYDSMIDSTPPNKESLLADIELIRQQGYAVSTSEVASGASCFAAPVRGYGKPIVIGIMGPETRMKPKISIFIDKLLSAAVRISRNISRI